MKRRKELRKYRAPYATAASVAFESNFCQTVRLQIKALDWDNINAGSEDETKGEYFEDIIS